MKNWTEHMPTHMRMTSYKLDNEGAFIYLWQFKMLGGFYAALMDAISKADGDNLDRLREGFPVEVDAYRKYTHTSGWWATCLAAVREGN